MSAASFRLLPNHLKGGELARVRAEWVPDEALGQPCRVELIEVDPDGGGGDVVAAFAATLEGADGEFHFARVTREQVPADVPDDMQLPGPQADTSRDGGYTYPREITWRRAHFKLQLDGDATEHLVILRSAAGRDPKLREGMRYELGLRVRDAQGELLFDAGSQVSSVDCWEALIGNCLDAVVNQYEGQVGMCEARPNQGGDYYGSTCGSQPAGKTSTDCVTYVLQVLTRAYEEARAASDARYLRQHAAMGAEFAPALADVGWALVLFVRDSERLCAEGGYFSSVYKTALQEGTLWGQPVELVEDYNRNGSYDAATDTWTDPEPDHLMLARFRELGDQVQFGVIALYLGSHVVMKVGDAIYECHWGHSATSPTLFDRSTSWEDLLYDDLFWMAAPLAALRPKPLPPLKPLEIKLLEVPVPQPTLELKPVPLAPVDEPSGRRRRRRG